MGLNQKNKGEQKTNMKRKSNLNSVRKTNSDYMNYQSSDGAVQVITKTSTAKRRPKHDYRIVCIRLRPEKGTRIQMVPGSDAVEILLTHKEVVQHLKALNSADSKCNYTWREIPEKSPERKAYWTKKNQQHWKK